MVTLTNTKEWEREKWNILRNNWQVKLKGLGDSLDGKCGKREIL